MPQSQESVYKAPEFLVDLLAARSPSGSEGETQEVVDRYVEPAADEYRKDALGNRLATVNPQGDPGIAYMGHMDELGLQVAYVDDNGFIYFNTIGGHDRQLISGRRVRLLNRRGVIRGVTGKRAIHLLTDEERKKIPEIHDIWIDIGAKSRKEALEQVEIGDVAVYDAGFELIRGSVGAARGFDNKAGAYVVHEALRRLAADREGLKARVTAIGTVQEEIGTVGAQTSAYASKAQFGVAVDVTHATDHPDCDKRRFGEVKLGGGPVILRGPNVNPLVYRRLLEVAETAKIPFQREAYPRPTPTDARSLQVARDGIACGLVSVPLRYMHTPSEMVDLEDVENAVRLLEAFARSFQGGERGDW